MNQKNPNLPQKGLLKSVKESFNIPTEKPSTAPRIPRTITQLGKTKGRKLNDWGY